jgi:hypothetical protein
LNSISFDFSPHFPSLLTKRLKLSIGKLFFLTLLLLFILRFSNPIFLLSFFFSRMNKKLSSISIENTVTRHQCTLPLVRDDNHFVPRLISLWQRIELANLIFYADDFIFQNIEIRHSIALLGENIFVMASKKENT